MDSGFIMAGLSSSFNGDVTSHHGSSTYPLYDYWVVKTDSLGNLLWEKCLGGSSDDLATDIIETSLNEYVVAGYSYSNDGDVTLNNGSLDFWIVKLGPTPVGIKGQKMESDISIYPNPSQGTINVEFPEQTLSIEVFNSTGQQIEKQNTKHQTKTTFNINEEGLYMLRIITGSEIITRKVVVGK